VRAKDGGICRLKRHDLTHVCNGPIQAAHGWSRRYRATRWDDRNGFPLCAGAHLKLTYDPIAWDELLHQWWGESLYWELRAAAKATYKPDFAQILEFLRLGDKGAIE